MLITACLLVETVVLKNMLFKSTTTQISHISWIYKIVTYVISNRFGEMFVVKGKPKIENPTDLVESVRKLRSTETMLVNFCRLTDRVIFAILTILYLILGTSLLPQGYLTANYTSIESLS